MGECLRGGSPRSILFPFRNSREDHQWPGQPRLSLKSASASRSTVICRPSSDSDRFGSVNHRPRARRWEEAFLSGMSLPDMPFGMGGDARVRAPPQ